MVEAEILERTCLLVDDDTEKIPLVGHSRNLLWRAEIPYAQEEETVAPVADIL
jgi:hypothetical protein